MRTSLTYTAGLICAAGLLLATTGRAEERTEEHQAPAAPPGLKLENLLRHDLAAVEGTEVVISRVTIPPHTALPKHWHPGEEFIYLLEGTVTLWQDGKEETFGEAGAVAMVPLRQVHTAITGDEGAVAVVFRVHEKDQPERTLAE